MAEQAMPTSPRQGAPEPKYDASYYSNYWGGGGPYERNERWLDFFDGVAEGLVREFHPATALDAGCAMGFLVEALHKRGVDASGVDVSEYAISQVHESVGERCRAGSLTEPLGGRYDLITCIEVLEHIPAAEADRAIENLCAATDTLVISSTPGDYGEPTHLNVQPPEAWAAKLAQHGFLRDLDRDLSYLSPWAVVYVRRDEPQAEIVRRYDRSWWQLRRELNEVRASLLESSKRISALEDPSVEENRPEILRELDENREEVLRLRDLLVGMEVELGAAQGKVVEYEDREKRLHNVKKQLEAKVPVFGKLAVMLWRMLRGQRG